MLRQRLRVAALDEGMVTLEGERAAACTRCAARSGCGAGALAEMLGGRQSLRLPQTLPLAVGDEVVVAMESGTFLGAAALAYLVPPAALAALAMLSEAFGLSNGVTAALAVPAFALSFVPLRRADRRELQHAPLRLEGLADDVDGR